MKHKNKKGTCLVRLSNGFMLMNVMIIGKTGLVFFKSEKYTPMTDFNWSLTHKDSGYAVCRFRTRKNLIAALDKILSLTDWTQSYEILKNPTLMKQMKQIQKEEQS